MPTTLVKRVVWRKLRNALQIPRGCFGHTGSGQIEVIIDLVTLADCKAMFQKMGRPEVICTKSTAAIRHVWLAEETDVLASVLCLQALMLP